jgi:hypothetical protein
MGKASFWAIFLTVKVLTQKWVGPHFGWFFHKLQIWPFCYGVYWLCTLDFSWIHFFRKSFFADIEEIGQDDQGSMLFLRFSAIFSKLAKNLALVFKTNVMINIWHMWTSSILSQNAIFSPFFCKNILKHWPQLPCQLSEGLFYGAFKLWF